MSRGRKRKPNPGIPAHIDQARLPNGIYWNPRGAGSWYVFTETDDGKRTTRTVANARARLSDLHTIAEQRSGVDRASLRWVCAQFEASPRFRRLAASTRASYQKSGKVLLAQPLKTGGTVGDLRAAVINRPFVQRLVDRIAAGHQRDAQARLIATPTKAVHVLSYLSVALTWAANRGLAGVASNPCEGIEAPAQRRQHRMPTATAYQRIIAYARAHAHDGRGVRGKPGTCPSYLWAAGVLAYQCRLRGIEVTTLTDAQLLEAGLLSKRRKGSRDNITAWTPEIRDACDALIARRTAIWTARSFPYPMDPARRPLIVSATGDPISKTGFDSAWQRMITAAITAGTISQAERFSLHGLKHKGITDTDGTRHDKQQASGHRTERLMDTYDHSVPTVLAASQKRHKIPGEPQ